VDGSDLRHYRKHSRAVYQAFRRVMEEVYRNVFDDYSSTSESVMKQFVPCARGTMDEMTGDISEIVNKLVAQPDVGALILSKLLEAPMMRQQKLYIFGEDSNSCVAHLVEDQTGASATVSLGNERSKVDESHLSYSRRNVHSTHNGDRVECRKRFQVASQLGHYICGSVEYRTQFHTTIGLSVSPMLAKIAGGLSKPKSVNILLPWRTATLMYCMPLRKIPNVGHRTMKVLHGAIRKEWEENISHEPITVQ
jgi:nucleotidyltransferase/DNA polymerase involved in DNA repair